MDYPTTHPAIGQAVITCNDTELDRPPHAPGVYRFFNAESALLYVGKSIDLSNRIRSHFSDARDPGRQQSMMSAVRRIDCQLTAGETGALLIENDAIKAEMPLYNRRQRRIRTLWTLRLTENTEGFLTLVPSEFCAGGERRESVYGLFRSRHHIDTAVRSLVRDEGLCLRALGFERGRGPCFQHQIGRCRGACAGHEGPATHNPRLLALLEQQQIAAWPFEGAVLLHEERKGKGAPAQPRRHYHLLNHWSYQGSFTQHRSARAMAQRAPERVFDRDTYRIALAALRRGDGEVVDAASGAPLHNPLKPYITASIVEAPSTQVTDTLLSASNKPR